MNVVNFCHVLSPGSSNAIAAVNAIRARARNHYDPITGQFLYTSTEPADISGLSGEELDIFIFEERVRELNMEMHLWHDLIRSPRMEYFIQEQQAMAIGGVKRVYSEKGRLMPIPQTELDANRLVEQNPGY